MISLHNYRFRLFAFLVGSLVIFGGTNITSASTSDDQEMLSYLSANIDWYQRVRAIDPSPVTSQEVLVRDAARQQARQSLEFAFEYARAYAANQTGPTKPGGGAFTVELNAAIVKTDARIAKLKQQVADLDHRIATTEATSQPSLSAQRDMLQAELSLANQQRSTVAKLSDFVGNSQGNVTGSLSDQIDELERSVPDITSGPQTQPADAPPESEASQGIVGLITELFNLSRTMTEVTRVADQSAKLLSRNEQIRSPMRKTLIDSSQRADAIAATRPSENPEKLAAIRKELETLNQKFATISSIAVPLREQSSALEASKASLEDWHSALTRASGRALRALLFRLIVLGGILAIVFLVSAFWRRATFKYVGDVRRRRQFLVVRRIVVAAVVTLVLVGGFVSEFGSLATYAGLLTAGIAVALQTVIVSGFAYFFFVGRYGVRVGDRITIGAVTGDVIDVGLFRLYLLELTGTDRDLRPSGRIVVFSNSVLLQPQPFFKQLPGADYVWHQVALTLSPDSDHNLAEKRLLGAVNEVYKTYSADILAQHETVNRATHLSLPEPKPEGWLRFVDAGLEFVVRYPVDIRNAPEVDDKITRKLLDAIEEESTLRLVASGTPRIQAVESPAATG